MATRFVPAARRAPADEPSPSTEKEWSSSRRTEARESAARGPPTSGRFSSTSPAGHGAMLTQFTTRRRRTSMRWTTSRPARFDASTGTQSGGGGGALLVNLRSHSPSRTMRSRGNEGRSSSVAAASRAATASSIRFAPSRPAVKRWPGISWARICIRFVRADALERVVVAESAAAPPQRHARSLRSVIFGARRLRAPFLAVSDARAKL
mmetsp:Transcript_32640/g.101018  ORF Transcript_32640/g.101018 Transcript_32640/m.101018 type:complete len:208 (+) Transcript_32640:397-1020(+)